ncbi:uncharacterized protein TNCT_180451 [Trichonephila clavata]|uniref:CCHC-type domain-containing protein n=1 Tax=Trichonephila clavata TaxID=2740835 RepID=A0A8X6HDA1_TRICU|nr:uncharacterized protein TNCT_180451 [Trichonephila clavata]
MLFLGRGKKANLIKLANDLDESESNGEDLKIIELRAKMLASDAYKEDLEFVKDIFEGIVSDRIDEEREQKEQQLQMLADKLEAFDNLRRSLPSGPKRYVKGSETLNVGRQVSSRKPERLPKREFSQEIPNERSPLKCYGCGKPGVIKSRCPTCNTNSSQRNDETTLAMSLEDGQQTTGEALTTQVMIEIEGRSVLTRFIILPKAKGNRTLLGTDFLSSAGLVLDVENACWYFWDNPTHKYPFGEELDTPRP